MAARCNHRQQCCTIYDRHLHFIQDYRTNPPLLGARACVIVVMYFIVFAAVVAATRAKVWQYPTHLPHHATSLAAHQAWVVDKHYRPTHRTTPPFFHALLLCRLPAVEGTSYDTLYAASCCWVLLEELAQTPMCTSISAHCK
jgi:hypothetical protein